MKILKNFSCIYFIIILVFYAFKPAYSASKCNEHLNMILDNLKQVEEIVPEVPDDIAKAFEEERKEKLTSGDPASLRELRKRNYYLAWGLRSQFKLAKAELYRLKYIPSSISIKKRIQESVFLPYRLSNARDSWTIYFENLTDTINSHKATAGSILMLSLGHTIGAYYLCLADEIVDNKDPGNQQLSK